MHIDIEAQAAEWGATCASEVFQTQGNPAKLPLSKAELALIIEFSIVALIKASQPEGTVPN